jgi:serine protease Do
VEGRPVERSGELPRVIGGTKPGTRTTLQVFRRGSYRDLTVTVAEIEPDKPRRVAQAESAPRANTTPIGLSVSDLSDAQRRELKVRGGVRVEAVEGAAARAGLREGDVILSVDNTEITSARQFTTLVEKADKSKPLTVLVRRGEQSNFLIIRPGGNGASR